MFTTEHFIWIAICIAFIIGMLLFCIKKAITLKTASYIMTIICAFSEISKMMTTMVESSFGGMYLNPRSLPFHLCSLMLFGVLYITFGKNNNIKHPVINFLAVMGTLGSFCALLIPTNGTNFLELKAYQCFVYHAGLLWFSLYLIISGNAKLGLKEYKQNIIILLSLVLITFYINSALSAYGTNFMYLVRPPMKNLPYLNLNKGWHIYFLRLLLLGFGLLTLFQLPFIVHIHKNKNISMNEAL